jgi:F-type H+-transporting ATPase subunit b
MRFSQGCKIFAGAAAVVLFTSASAYAAEEGASATEHANEIFKWINFAILAGLIGWICLKLAPGFFRRNAAAISSEIAKATDVKTEADRQLLEAKEKLARLAQEVAQLRADAQRESVAEAERIRRATQSDKEKIALAAKAEIEAAERAARLELKGIAANLAVDGAESLLVKQLTPQAQESLVAGFVKSLEGKPN